MCAYMIVSMAILSAMTTPIKSALFKRMAIVDTTWDSELVTSTYSDINICQRDSLCLGFHYDFSTKECQLSTEVYKWLLDITNGNKIVHMKITSDFQAEQRITKIDMQTGSSVYDDCNCDLIVTVCVDGNCCTGNTGHEYHGYGELIVLEGSSLGTCQDFLVPDYRQAEFFIHQAVYNDGWDGTHVDIWLNAENTWRIRCGRVGGGELVVNGSPQLLECNLML